MRMLFQNVQWFSLEWSDKSFPSLHSLIKSYQDKNGGLKLNILTFEIHDTIVQERNVHFSMMLWHQSHDISDFQGSHLSHPVVLHGKVKRGYKMTPPPPHTPLKASSQFTVWQADNRQPRLCHRRGWGPEST